MCSSDLTWSVLRHMFPQADIPVVQLSLDMSKPEAFHFALGQKLRPLREEGVLLVGSGNMVHNLSMANFSQVDLAYDWAEEFDLWLKDKLMQRDFTSIVESWSKHSGGKRSIPTLEHFLPLLYILWDRAEPTKRCR